MHHQQGFTLIELLIVIAIMSILMCIGYPNYQHHLQKAYCQQGKQNLHHISTELEHYATLHGNYLNATPETLKLPSFEKNSHYHYHLAHLTAQHYTITAQATSAPVFSTIPTCQHLSLSDTNQTTSISTKNA